MEFTNSPLAEFTRLSPMHSGHRKYPITRITPHVYEGQVTVEQMGAYFAEPDRQVSCNYCIGKDGRIGLIVEEQNRSWCSSNADNDGRGITIECASEKTPPYTVNPEVFGSLVNLSEDICRRYGKTKLLWLWDKAKTLAYKPAEDEMIITVHQWFANTSCPGEWMMDKMAELALQVTARLSDVSAPIGVPMGLQAKDLFGLTDSEVIEKVGPLFTDEQRRTGLQASWNLGQWILESNCGKSDVFRNSNNGFGMHTFISSNTWPGTCWDGESRYNDYRAYTDIETAIQDHSAYLLGATDDNEVREHLRYAGIKNCTDYKEAAHILLDGGYATDPAYAINLIRIIEYWDLTRFNLPTEHKEFVSDTITITRQDFETLKSLSDTLTTILHRYEG